MAAKFRPIRNDTEHEAALEEIERLWDARPGTDAADRLEVLSILVEAYEREHHPVLPPSPIDAILFRLEQLNSPRSFLERLIGHKGHVSEVLSGKRGLSLGMIRKIHAVMKIPAEILIAPTTPQPPRSQAKAPARRKPSDTQRAARPAHSRPPARLAR